VRRTEDVSSCHHNLMTFFLHPRRHGRRRRLWLSYGLLWISITRHVLRGYSRICFTKGHDAQMGA
jgi:hypothetical protein